MVCSGSISGNVSFIKAILTHITALKNKIKENWFILLMEEQSFDTCILFAVKKSFSCHQMLLEYTNKHITKCEWSSITVSIGHLKHIIHIQTDNTGSG